MIRIECLGNNWYEIVCNETEDDVEFSLGCVDDEGTFLPGKKAYYGQEASYMCKGIEQIRKLKNEAKREDLF